MASMRVSLALEQLPVFFSLLDRQRRIVWASRYDYGVTPETLLGTTGEQYLHRDDLATYQDAFARCLHSREVVGYEVRLRAPETNGRIVRVIGVLSPVVLAGRVRYVAAVARDARAVAAALVPPRPVPVGELAGALWLSPRAASVLASIPPGDAWTPAATVAERIGENLSTTRVLCRELVDRGFLASSRSRGYRHAR